MANSSYCLKLIVKPAELKAIYFPRAQSIVHLVRNSRPSKTSVVGVVWMIDPIFWFLTNVSSHILGFFIG